MHFGTSKQPVVRGNLLPHSVLATAVARRAEQVSELVIKRRRIAVAYRRSQREDQRLALAQIDQALAQYNIDIPAIQRRMSKS